MITKEEFEELHDSIKRYAFKMHNEFPRKDGRTEYDHIVSVMNYLLLKEVFSDYTYYIVALFHDSIERHGDNFKIPYLNRHDEAIILNLIWELTPFDSNYAKRKERKYLEAKNIAENKNHNLITIKLADIIDNFQSADSLGSFKETYRKEKLMFLDMLLSTGYIMQGYKEAEIYYECRNLVENC